MKRILLSLLMASATTWAMADPGLIGSWVAKTSENGALPGTLRFEKDGAAELHPEGFDAAKGKWVLQDKKKKVLRLTLNDIGSSDMGYVLKRNELTLIYDNGNKQVFVRQTPGTKQ